MKNYDKNIDKGHIFEVDIEYPKNLHDLHNDLSFLPEIMKLKKCNKLVCNLYDIEKYVVQKRALQQTLNNGLVLKKAHTITKFKQKAWMNPNNDMNRKLRTEIKIEFEKNFFKLMTISVFWKTMDIIIKHKDIRFITTDKRKRKYTSNKNE